MGLKNKLGIKSQLSLIFQAVHRCAEKKKPSSIDILLYMGIYLLAYSVSLQITEENEMSYNDAGHISILLKIL
jgi:hypothetical protein